MTTISNDTSLLRLMQLSSAALPVGGYSFSQGLEYAIDSDWLSDSASIELWLAQQLNESIALIDLPILIRQLNPLHKDKLHAVQESMLYWNAYILACRETAELRLTDTAMGAALMKLLADLDIYHSTWIKQDISFVTAFAIAAKHWQIPPQAACHGYAWSWLENQIVAATKLLPLGQTAAQKLLGQLLTQIPAAIERAESLVDEAIGSSLPALAMASVWHETQRTRLFRS